MTSNDLIQRLNNLPLRLTTTDILRELGINYQALRKRWKAGLFPEPHKDEGSRLLRWWKHEIIQYYSRF